MSDDAVLTFAGFVRCRAGGGKGRDSAAGPVFVTRNGHESFVSMSMAEYEGLLMEAARAKLYERIARAEDDVAGGCVSDATDTASQLRARYGL